MINLGLSRISRLLDKNQKWKAIHIAGTNGKGSVAAYLSALLRHIGRVQRDSIDKQTSATYHDAGRSIAVGRFTSPHLIDRWDCITINDQAVSRDVFEAAENDVKKKARWIAEDLARSAAPSNTTTTKPGNQSQANPNAPTTMNLHDDATPTEFELLTATAFSLFSSQPCDLAVVECGLGGSLDATNALDSSNIAVSVLTRMGMDHVDILGGSMRSIAREKCGIVRENVPVVVDGGNSEEVLGMIREELRGRGGDEWVGRMVFEVKGEDLKELITDWESFEGRDDGRLSRRDGSLLHDLMPHQRSNLAVALKVLQVLRTQAQLNGIDFDSKPLSPDLLELVLSDAARSYPARLQWLSPGWLDNVPSQHNLGALNEATLLLDGAHNEQSAVVLQECVDRYLSTMRATSSNSKAGAEHQARRAVIWILALSSTKSAIGILRTLFVEHVAAKGNDSPPTMSKIIFTSFGPVDGMPWVKPTPSAELVAAVGELRLGLENNRLRMEVSTTSNIIEALQDAERYLRSERADESGIREDGVESGGKVEKEKPLIVIAGSLYLASDFLRFVRDGSDQFLEGWAARHAQQS